MSNPITQLKIQTLSQSGPKYEEGWDFLTTDLNQRAGGKYIYLGFQAISGNTPVTSIDVKAYDSAQSNPPSGLGLFHSPIRISKVKAITIR
jgi:hypothetical protein